MRFKIVPTLKYHYRTMIKRHWWNIAWEYDQFHLELEDAEDRIRSLKKLEAMNVVYKRDIFPLFLETRKLVGWDGKGVK